MLKILLLIYVFLYQREPNFPLIILHDDAEALWYKLRGLIDSFDGVAEKFYSYFYALFLNNLLPTKFDDNTLTNTLMSELANEILVHLSGCKHLELEPKDCSLPEKELKTLQYLAGFCIHKLYTKFRFSRNSASAFHNQYCLILHACKVENDDTQALVNVRDRGEEDCGKYVKKCKIYLWNVRSCSGQKLQLLHLRLSVKIWLLSPSKT